jgi:hypothetical protein
MFAQNGTCTYSDSGRGLAAVAQGVEQVERADLL